jgi:hypothetical protein
MLPDAGFPVAACAVCGRDVLTHLEFDELDRSRRRCVHCNAELDPDELRWVPRADLEALGYGELGEEGAGGCGRPGCGNGACGRR